ncbi:MAG: ATP-binding cassette domain-containing protein [Lachnospiraceae bacterium]|nr:ATP-binding cassette domain-containing protein [Lachnospiraceae bacterium]
MKLGLSSVTKAFDKEILNDFTINFKEGKTTALLGPSGCGKTTIVNLLLGLMKADKGEIIADRTAKMSVVFQEDRLMENITVLENLLAINKNVKTCKEILNAFGIGEVDNKYPNQLSGGMKRRVALARAIAFNGDIFILDEPFKGIDISLKQKVIKEIKKAINGKTCVIITHEITEAVSVGDEVFILGGNPLIIKRNMALDETENPEKLIREYLESDF